ncbi:MAG: efflux RND transporter permease subunit [Deltaproteobacteria bacterium]|nr:efflux RND transporter permease subunit [Deltaproteobacteria bacterium]
MILAKFAVEKQVVSALATLLILAAGYLAYQKLPRFEDPEFIIRQAQVVTSYPGASAAEVADEVTDAIETAAQQLPGVKEVRSVSSAGLSEVTVEFAIAAAKTRSALERKFTRLRAKVSDVAGRLPPGASAPTVYDDFGDVFALYYAITGEGYSLVEIAEYAKQLQKDLALVPGVSRVQLIGVPREAVFVEYRTARLVQLGLSPERLGRVLEGQNLVTSAGSVRADGSRLAVRPAAAVATLEAIGDLVVTDAEGARSFRLRDIATVRHGIRDAVEQRLFRNGRPAIGLGISSTIGGNVVELGDAVKARLAELTERRPVGIDLVPISDQSESVRESVKDFVGNVILALAIVVGTLFVFMGVRSGILMGGILLVTVAGTLFGMYAYGLDMQRISLGALIIALGMLVDNAIVVVDGTLVRVRQGEDPGAAAVSVAGKTLWPLLGGTLVGVLAFAAIGFSPDNTGEYAGSLFWTIAIALLFSWLVAVWLTPYYCTLLLKRRDPGADEAVEEALILRIYRRLLTGSLRRRWGTLGLVAVLFASALASFGLVRAGFFPESTRAQFVVDYVLPQGTDIERTSKDIVELGEWIRTLEGVTGTNAVVGGGHLRFMLTYSGASGNPAYGQVLVDVEHYSRIAPLMPRIAGHVEGNYPDSRVKVWKFALGPGGGSLVEARFSGPDPVVLRRLAERAKTVYASEGAVGIQDDWGEMAKVLRPRVNEQRARRAGLSQADVSRAIAAHFDGAVIGVFREGNDLHPIVFRPVAADRDRVEKIRRVHVFSPLAGRYVPISQVVNRFDLAVENARLRRFDRTLAIMAQADPPPGVNAGELFARIRPGVEGIELPPGYALEWRGQHGGSQDANRGLAATMPYGFAAMIVVVFLLFNAIRQPVIVYLTAPLALIGVVYGLIFTGTPMEFVAILATLSLAGMLIKNTIVLIDETDAQIAEGKARMAAVVDAAVSRVRPVSLGMLTTVLGVTPLIWDPFFRSLAVVIICGLGFATVLTLIVVPVLYAVFFGIGADEGSVSPPAKEDDGQPSELQDTEPETA